MSPEIPERLKAESLTKPFETSTERLAVSPKADVCTVFTPVILGWGGGERSCVALADWLDRNGVRCRFLVYRDTLGIHAHSNPRLEEVQLLPADGPLNKVA